MHVDFAVLVQLYTRHLSDEGIEHRAFGHVEGIGIVYQCVAAIDHLHLRCRDDHLVQVAAIEL